MPLMPVVEKPQAQRGITGGQPRSRHHGIPVAEAGAILPVAAAIGDAVALKQTEVVGFEKHDDS